MENTNHWLDDDFEKINCLFEEYASSSEFKNVEDFKSAVKTKLTNQVWKTLYKIPKNKILMEEYAADFVEALNECINANLNKIKNGTMTEPFSKYIYNIIPGRLKSAANKEQAEIGYIKYSKGKTKKIREIVDCYEYLKKCGVIEHNKIIRKIAIMKAMSEVEVERYYQLHASGKTSINQQYTNSDDTYDVLSEEAGKQEDYSSPEKDYLLHSDMISVFSSINDEWKKIKQKKTESDSVFINRKQMMSELLTVYILKKYRISFEKKSNLVSYATNKIDFDISEAINEYSFLNKSLVENFIKSDDCKLPTQTEIGAKYSSPLKKDGLTRMRDRFIEKAIRNLK